MKRFNYLARCDDFDKFNVLQLNEMTALARDSSYEAMRRNCAGLLEWAKNVGYDRDLPLKKDWAVSYHRSRIFGRRCYYLRWSGFEVIWVAGDPKGLMKSHAENQDP